MSVPWGVPRQARADWSSAGPQRHGSEQRLTLRAKGRKAGNIMEWQSPSDPQAPTRKTFPLGHPTAENNQRAARPPQ